MRCQLLAQLPNNLQGQKSVAQVSITVVQNDRKNCQYFQRFGIATPAFPTMNPWYLQSNCPLRELVNTQPYKFWKFGADIAEEGRKLVWLLTKNKSLKAPKLSINHLIYRYRYLSTVNRYRCSLGKRIQLRNNFCSRHFCRIRYLQSRAHSLHFQKLLNSNISLNKRLQLRL